jgi:CheY-like chemotaxis protein
MSGLLGLSGLISSIQTCHTSPDRSKSHEEVLALAPISIRLTRIGIRLMSTPMFPRCRILVVDDEPFVCDAVRMMLAFDGHEVVTADCGRAALAALEKGKFDLVITDFAMPVMKGDQLAATIKERNPAQPVVMITAYAEMLLASGGPPLACVDHVISKPFLLENLRDAIAKVVPRDSRTAPSGSAPDAGH